MNQRGELTEFTKGNLVLQLDGQCVTPPVSCGLLDGTYRSWLLEQGKLVERVLRPEAVSRADAIYLINSVRRWVQIEFEHPAGVDSRALS